MTSPLTIPLTLVNDSDRARKKYGNLEGLKNSLKTIGSIHPIVLSRGDSGTYDLVAGGRRLRSTQELGYTELVHGSILTPGEVGFLFREEVEQDVLKEAELDENLYRLNTEWTEDVILIADVHEAKKAKDPKWGQRQTSALLGEGYGLTKVTHAIRLAKLIRSGDENILACGNMMEAISVLVKRKEDEALAELHKRATPGVGMTTDLSGILDTLNISLGKKPILGKVGDAPLTQPSEIASAVAIPQGSGEPAVQPSGSPVLIPLSKMFMLGDCLPILANMPDACVDHVVTDIPYGIDMTNLDTNSRIDSVEAEHDVKGNVALMEPFLRESYRLVKSGGFCVFFYDLDWHEYLQATAESIGWRVQRWPFIACKTSSAQNNAAQYNLTKNYECAMFLRRDERTVLRHDSKFALNNTAWRAYDFGAERALYRNAFAKPFQLWKDIYEMVSFSGQSILDPYMGEASSSRAAINCGLVPFGIEINEQHFNQAMNHIKSAYAVLHGNNVEFQ